MNAATTGQLSVVGSKVMITWPSLVFVVCDSSVAPAIRNEEPPPPPNPVVADPLLPPPPPPP